MAVVLNTTHYADPESTDAHFDHLFYGSDYFPTGQPFPRIAHFVYATPDPINWINYLAVQGAIKKLKVDRVKIWIPQDVELPGKIWGLIKTLPQVEFVPILMPDSVYGHTIEDPAGKTDVVRLKVLYQEGGIYLENDLVALRSIDHILGDEDSPPTVMAERTAPPGLPNWMIISKPRSPFLRRWMESYKADTDWSELATEIPLNMLKDRDQHLTALSGKSWYYPLASALDSDASLKKLWFGKSWYDIDESYGTHVWHWLESYRNLITPAVVAEIDTPLFCRLRPLFADVYSHEHKPWEEDLNCAIINTASLSHTSNSLFADYNPASDLSPYKLLDASGSNLHGWSPNGTEHGGNGRTFFEGDYAVLPVPIHWDTRAWTLQTSFKLSPYIFDPEELTVNTTATFLKIRLAGESAIFINLKPDVAAEGSDTLKLGLDIQWQPSKAADMRDLIYPATLPDISPFLASSAQHTLTISFDREERGKVYTFLDDDLVGENDVSKIDAPRFASDIWVNALDWDSLDGGFRGQLQRLTFWAEAIPQENITVGMAGTPKMSKSSGGFKTYIGRGNFARRMKERGREESNWLFTFLVLLLLLVVAGRYWGKIRRQTKELNRYVAEWMQDLGVLSRQTAYETGKEGKSVDEGNSDGYA